MMFRRRRIVARLRESSIHEEIANEEGVTIARIRQIVSAELSMQSCSWSVSRQSCHSRPSGRRGRRDRQYALSRGA